ncbi:Nn.00g084840.m01.CDS01 [Neocucurbitaria sp. VM-36]
MRLINTKTGQLEDFLGQEIPKYAILSHTWGEEEVSYQDYLRNTHKSKKGYRKIQKTCDIAAEAKIPYAWVDTLCIDKKSSAELSEAINSMYRWYEQSKVCYAFLSDLSGDAELKDALAKCRWFTRGWTLQELIAPKVVSFYDARWKIRGLKSTLASQLSTITNINESVLRIESPLSEFCVAQKLSWAALRVTTRIEDNAYCLLGLFDLNMPLLYGEGEKAFRRLQEEIIRSSGDLSIFAWKFKHRENQQESPSDQKKVPLAQPSPQDGLLCGVLAQSTVMFAQCSEYKRSQGGGHREFSVTNIGIKIRVRILLRRLDRRRGMGYVLPLNCTFRGRALGLRLRQVGSEGYLRENPSTLLEYDDARMLTAPPSERNLLIALPKDSFPPHIIEGYSKDVLPLTRTHVLQFVPQTTLLLNPWPVDRYDHEDESFFVFRDSNRDYSIIELLILIQAPNPATGFVESEWLRCKFCALGWSSTAPGIAQFGLFEEAKHASSLNAIQPQVADWDRTSAQLAYYLNRYNIPKLAVVRYPLPKLGKVAHVTFSTKREENHELSTNPFWSIQFSYDLWSNNVEPHIDQADWELD